MKPIFSFLIFFSSYRISAQNIVGEYWHINEVIGSDTENIQEFTLYKIDKKDKYYAMYGTRIIFNNENSFNCNYSAKCGNDCFSSSFGTYKMTDTQHIDLYVKAFSQVGDCKSINKVLNLKYWKFLYIKAFRENNQTN